MHLTYFLLDDNVNQMGLIVISRVLKYRALILGTVLLLTLAFFQSNQALDESSVESSNGGSAPSQSGAPETPSIPKTPNLPGTPNLPDNDDSTIKISISIKTTTNANESGGESESDEEITIEKIERVITNGSISLTFTSNGEEQSIKEKIENEVGKVSVKFRTKSDIDSENEFSQETVIKEERSTD